MPTSNAGASALVLWDDVGREVGREKLGGLDGGDEGYWRKGDDGFQPMASAVSDEAA